MRRWYGEIRHSLLPHSLEQLRPHQLYGIVSTPAAATLHSNLLLHYYLLTRNIKL